MGRTSSFKKVAFRTFRWIGKIFCLSSREKIKSEASSPVPDPIPQIVNQWTDSLSPGQSELPYMAKFGWKYPLPYPRPPVQEWLDESAEDLGLLPKYLLKKCGLELEVKKTPSKIPL